MRDDWWVRKKKKNHKRPVYLKAWVDICRPKCVGGLGLRRM